MSVPAEKITEATEDRRLSYHEELEELSALVRSDATPVPNIAQFYRALMDIKNEPGKNAKKELLAQFICDYGADFVDLLRLGFDSYVRFGFQKMPKYVDRHFNLPISFSVLKSMCDALSSGEITGNMAAERVAYTLSVADDHSREMIKMVLTKDFKCGFSVDTVNKVLKGVKFDDSPMSLIPTFSCMLAKPFESKRITYPAYVEPKLDGVRVLAICRPRRTDEELRYTVEFVSRTGRSFTSFDHIGEMIATRLTEMIEREGITERGYVFDGEMVSGSFNETVSQVRKKNARAEDAIYTVFHFSDLHQFGQGKDLCSYGDRRKYMIDFFARAVFEDRMMKVSPAYIVNSEAEVLQIYGNVRKNDGEGVIVKHPLMPYESKRSFGWLKIKGEESVDVRVTGHFEGTGKYEGQMGGLIVDVDGVSVRVGGGFSDHQRSTFWNSMDEVLGRLIEVQYHEKTPDGSLRHPRFIRFRDDKDAQS